MGQNEFLTDMEDHPSRSIFAEQQLNMNKTLTNTNGCRSFFVRRVHSAECDRGIKRKTWYHQTTSAKASAKGNAKMFKTVIFFSRLAGFGPDFRVTLSSIIALAFALVCFAFNHAT